MKTPLIYLAGPITGSSYGDCTDWRIEVQSRFADIGLAGISPMRHKDHLLQETSVKDAYDDKAILSTQRGIYARDFWDTTRADAVFVNLLNAERVSIGTVMEISWARQNNTPIILIMEPAGNPHEHAMLREACPFRVDTIEEGILVASSLFSQDKLNS